MRRIDQATVQKILETADIVEVVSDFVHLKRRGSGYIGLCPFHNERTPSFSVSKSKGICKCFSCGKGGSPVNFIMELEQMTYNEALRYLAKKYNIEIQEHELSEKEREEASERESMMAVNDFAMHHFESTLSDTDDGRNIGLSYFRERGISDAMIKRFHLGYSLEKRDDLYTTALRKGFNEKYLLESGLCFKTERGTIQDRFRGRVIYPVFTVSGKVVAFGGRTLRKDKDIAKYVNSPESIVYRKSYELYGLYQAKQAIVKRDKCILVEGYMDVISMHQRGIENVVASSGTSLTDGQIRLIHRFTENVTVIYDSDPAGIKASLRGIDMLLAEGLNIKVLLLPDGDDPDSFAQSHTSSEVEEYISGHETDFIGFKISILMAGIKDNDPVARARVISDIVRSISMIPDNIIRTVYIGECSRTMGIDEKVLTFQVAKYVAERSEREANEAQRRRNRKNAGLTVDDSSAGSSVDISDIETENVRENAVDDADIVRTSDRNATFLAPYEHDVVRLAVKYGMMYLGELSADESGVSHSMTVLDYVVGELAADGITIANGKYAAVLNAAIDTSRATWSDDLLRFRQELEARRNEKMRLGIENIRQTAEDMSAIESMETQLRAKIDEDYSVAIDNFSAGYIEKILLSSPDDIVRSVTTELVSERYKLSKIHTKFTKIATERDRLSELLPLAVYNLKEALIECEIHELTEKIGVEYSHSTRDFNEIRRYMQRIGELNVLKKELSKYLGERTLLPQKR